MLGNNIKYLTSIILAVKSALSKYVPNRSMKRAKKSAMDLECFERPPIATREQYELFYEYQKYRHLDSDMAEMNFNEYIQWSGGRELGDESSDKLPWIQDSEDNNKNMANPNWRTDEEEEKKIREAMPDWYENMPVGTELIMYARGTAISNDLQFDH